MAVSTKVLDAEGHSEKGYYKYYGRSLIGISPQWAEIAENNSRDIAKAHRIEERELLFNREYLPVEDGYWVLENGTGVAAARTEMPGVTPRKLAWYMLWFSLDPLRYRIWYPKGHFSVKIPLMDRIGLHVALKLKTTSVDRLIDRIIAGRNKTTSCRIVEDHGYGVNTHSVKILPSKKVFGNKLSEAGDGTFVLVCNGVTHDDRTPPAAVVHFCRETAGGLEMRSRFWIGYHFDGDSAKKMMSDDQRVDPIIVKFFATHCHEEMNNLAAILPQLYEEEYSRGL